MAAMATAGALLALIIAAWQIALAADNLLRGIFGAPKGRPPRRRPY